MPPFRAFRRVRSIPLLVALSLWSVGMLAPTATAQVSPPESVTVNSRAYEIVTNLTKDELKDLANHMDATYAAFDRMFSAFRTKNAKRVKLYLWADRNDYVQHGFSIGADLRASGGVFFSRDGEAGVSTWVRGQPSGWLREVLQHEAFHQFADLRFGDTLPMWVNEGLATYFQHARLVDGRMVLAAAPRDRIEELHKAFESGDAFTFAEMVDMTNRRWWEVLNTEPHRASLLYTQSWSMAHFLVHADRGKYERLFLKYLRRIAQGWEHDAAFKDAFRTDDKSAFQRAWKEYVLEELKPDLITEATERLEFIAEGMLAVHADGFEFETLEELRGELKRRRFSVSREHDGQRRRTLVSDEMFEAPQPAEPERRRSRGGSTGPTLELVEAADGVPLPGVVVEGLKVDVELKWTLDEAGQPFYLVEYDD